MDTQSVLTSDGIKVESSSSLADQMIVDSEVDIKTEKEDAPKSAVSSTTSTSTHDTIQSTPTSLATTVIATRSQRMITTQGHITEISVAPSSEVHEDFEQYQITASGDDQNVYTYEATPSGIIISSPPDHLPPGGLIKRDMLIEKDHNGSGTTVNVVNAEPQTVYVELKNEALEQARFIPNAIRYDPSADRYHRFHPYHHGQHPPPPPPHYVQHQPREISMKSDAQQAQEIQIYEAEQNHQNSNDQNNLQEHSSNEPKTHYTNLEPVGSSQNSYYISATENYQPATGNGFAYLTTQPAKEGSYVYHHATAGSPVLYKST